MPISGQLAERRRQAPANWRSGLFAKRLCAPKQHAITAACNERGAQGLTPNRRGITHYARCLCLLNPYGRLQSSHGNRHHTSPTSAIACICRLVIAHICVCVYQKYISAPLNVQLSGVYVQRWSAPPVLHTSTASHVFPKAGCATRCAKNGCVHNMYYAKTEH